MTLYKFRKLSELEQSIIIWKQGAFIAQRSEGKRRIFLFQLFAFYVEVFFNSEERQYESLRPFNSTHQLKEYLAQIDISELVDAASGTEK